MTDSVRYASGMRIELRDSSRRRIGRIEVDPARRPTRVSIAASGREVFLNWDSALDDAGHLRRCVACGCTDLYRTKAFPQITGFVVMLAFAGAVVGALGYATTPPILAAMVVVLVADVAILLLARRRLVCYRCRSSFHDLPIAGYHRRWDRALADRRAPEALPAAAGPVTLRARLRRLAARLHPSPRPPRPSRTTPAGQRTVA